MSWWGRMCGVRTLFHTPLPIRSAVMVVLRVGDSMSLLLQRCSVERSLFMTQMGQGFGHVSSTEPCGTSCRARASASRAAPQPGRERRAAQRERDLAGGGSATDPRGCGAGAVCVRPYPTRSLQCQVGELHTCGVGGQRGAAVTVDVGHTQLGAGVGALLAHDQPHLLGPAGQVEHAGDVGDPSTVADLPLGVVGGGHPAGGTLRIAAWICSVMVIPTE